MRISISEEVSERVPHVALGVIRYTVDVEKSDANLLEFFNQVVEKISKQYELNEIAEIPAIHATREAYKALEKSPSQYRNAAEAMLRRIVKGKGLYQINNVVEVNNLISIESGYSIGSYDLAKLKGEVELKHASKGGRYEGIGKKEVNIENLPTLFDEYGAFGNPTSDSIRAMIKEGKREVISFIYAFDSNEERLEYWISEFQHRIERFTNATDIQTKCITNCD